MHALLLSVALLAGCASLASKTEGVSGPVTWQATDLELARRTVANRNLWFYSFSLLLKEMQGTGMVFNEIQTTIYQPGTSPWSGTYNGAWRLEANGQMRIPLVSSLSCHPSADSCGGPNVPAPLLQVILSGKSDQDRRVRIVIDITLPPDPPATPVATSKSVPATSLTRSPARQ